MTHESDIVCKNLFIEGRVQGVFFRVHTRDQARALGVTGWVRNLPDGRVEVLACGPKDAVDRLVRWCHRGPVHAVVTRVEVRDMEPDPALADFTIRYY
jgi:acylphosphatase